MKRLLAAVTAGLLSLGVGACGGGSKTASRPLGTAATVAATGMSTLASTTAPPDSEDNNATRYFLKDNDNDIGGTRENISYHDHDDPLILAAYGHPASATVRKTVTSFVKRYYALATADDGTRGCAMIFPHTVKAVPLDYGRFGPPYLHSAKTCPQVLFRLFRHHHRELSVPVSVTGVLVSGQKAYALLGSTKMHASFIRLRRWHGRWWIEGVFGGRII